MSSSLLSNISTKSLEPNTHSESPLKRMKSSRSDETLGQIKIGETIKVKNYELFKEIGKGAFGSVYLGKRTNTEELFAIKSLDKLFLANTNKVHTALIEREVLKLAKHDSIIKLLSAFQTTSKLFYVLEYQPNGSLRGLMDNFGTLSYQLAKFYLAEIVNALDYLHNSLQVAHRDLKPENIMLSEDYHLKLIDFGSATIEVRSYDEKTKDLADICSKHQSRNELVGTPEYCAPEILNQNTVSCFSNDIWSLGCLMYLFFHGKTPFAGKFESDTLRNIKEGQYSIHQNLPEDVKDLIRKMLETDQTKRITLEQIRQHDFFKGINFETITASKVPIIIEDVSNNLFKASQGDTSSTSDSWLPEPEPKQTSVERKEKDFSITLPSSPIVLIDSYFNFNKESSLSLASPKLSSSSSQPRLIFEGIITQVSWLSKVTSMKLYSNNTLILQSPKTSEITTQITLTPNTSIELFPHQSLLKITPNQAQALKLKSTLKELQYWRQLLLQCITSSPIA